MTPERPPGVYGPWSDSMPEIVSPAKARRSAARIRTRAFWLLGRRPRIKMAPTEKMNARSATGYAAAAIVATGCAPASRPMGNRRKCHKRIAALQATIATSSPKTTASDLERQALGSIARPTAQREYAATSRTGVRYVRKDAAGMVAPTKLQMAPAK